MSNVQNILVYICVTSVSKTEWCETQEIKSGVHETTLKRPCTIAVFNIPKNYKKHFFSRKTVAHFQLSILRSKRTSCT